MQNSVSHDLFRHLCGGELGLAVRMAAAQEAPQAQQGGGEAQAGSRHRRRRDRGNSGGQPGPVSGQPRQSPEPAHQKGGQQAVGAKVHGRGAGGQNGYGHGDNGRGRGGGRYSGYDSHNGYSKGGRGYGEERGGKGQKGARDNYPEAFPAPPPWPNSAPPEEPSLKDLLLQVAPHARIAENASRLSSKTSANILSKVLFEASQNGSQEPGAVAASSSTDGGFIGGVYYEVPPKQEEDDESAFMEKWSGLFSKGSPLVEGSLEDPFSDLKKRAKVVWKKNDERRGHRERYQERKKQKEQLKDEGGDYAGAGGTEVMYDASWPQQWQPQRAPSGEHGEAARTQWQPQRPPAGNVSAQVVDGIQIQ